MSNQLEIVCRELKKISESNQPSLNLSVAMSLLRQAFDLAEFGGAEITARIILSDQRSDLRRLMGLATWAIENGFSDRDRADLQFSTLYRNQVDRFVRTSIEIALQVLTSKGISEPSSSKHAAKWATLYDIARAVTEDEHDAKEMVKAWQQKSSRQFRENLAKYRHPAAKDGHSPYYRLKETIDFLESDPADGLAQDQAMMVRRKVHGISIDRNRAEFG